MEIYYKNNFIQIDNYGQINNINNDLIILNNLIIKGNNLSIIYLDKDRIKIKGIINMAYKGDNDEIPSDNDKK